MKKLLLLALMVGFAAPNMFAGEAPSHLLIYKCTSKSTEYGDGDAVKKTDRAFVLLEIIDATGELKESTVLEYGKDGDDKWYEDDGDFDLDDVVIADTGDGKARLLLHDDDAASAEGNLKERNIGEVNDEKVERDVAKTLKGSGFEEWVDNNIQYFETEKATYRLWSKATKAANSDDVEDGDANGDFDAAEALLIEHLEDKGYVVAPQL
ncbi:MAG: hypothetical protein ACYTDT_13930 [Planctomycetota bacterium]|jgi:hypothetical protein